MVVVSTKQAVNIEFYMDRDLILEIKLTKMRYIMNGNNFFIKRLTNDALRVKHINKTAV